MYIYTLSLKSLTLTHTHYANTQAQYQEKSQERSPPVDDTPTTYTCIHSLTHKHTHYANTQAQNQEKSQERPPPVDNTPAMRALRVVQATILQPVAAQIDRSIELERSMEKVE